MTKPIRLVLISTYNQEAGFNVGNAMGRNRYICALADFAVVVSSDYQEGGTWAGADEELRRESGRPVFVRTGAGVPKGNTELLRKGAKPFPADALTAGPGRNRVERHADMSNSFLPIAGSVHIWLFAGANVPRIALCEARMGPRGSTISAPVSDCSLCTS